MHEYVEVQFTRKGKPFRLKRQVQGGFVFDEPDAPVRTLDIGFAAADDGTLYRLARIRRIKGWPDASFKLRVSVEDGSLVIRGDDEYSLPEGWYRVTANVEGAKASAPNKRTELPHDSHGVVKIDLAFDERKVTVDLTSVDPLIRRVLDASSFDGSPARVGGFDWVCNADIRAERRACALNLLAMLRVFPTVANPLLTDVSSLFVGRDDRTYAQITPQFHQRVRALADDPKALVYAEGAPHAPIHEELLEEMYRFDQGTRGQFTKEGLLSYRAEQKGSDPSLQMVIATPVKSYASHFADLDLDLGNPLQDIAGFAVHMGELLDGKPTSHLDLERAIRKGRAGSYICYAVA